LLDVARQIEQQGEEGIKSLLGRPETFQLEFKRKDEPLHARLSDNDKRSIANEVSGFANAEGGLLIFGVGTGQERRQDVANELLPISQLRDFETEVRASIAQHISPPLNGVETLAVPSADDPKAGYLLIAVPASDNAPHMSMAPKEQRYYRRAGESTVRMDDRLVRTMVLAPREVQLKTVWRLSSKSSRGGPKRTFKADLDLCLLNESYRNAQSPFLRLKSALSLHFGKAPRDDLSWYRDADGSVSAGGSNTAVAHPSIPFPMMRLDLSVAIDARTFDKLRTEANYEALLDPALWLIGPSADGLDIPHDAFSGGAELVIAYAAENASPKAQRLTMEKRHLVAKLVQAICQPDPRNEEAQRALKTALGAISDPDPEDLPLGSAFGA
jgi:hypothetical protein